MVVDCAKTASSLRKRTFSTWKIFLKHLAAIDKVEVIELKLLRSEDRKALVRMAWLEEELRKREI